MRLTTVLAVLFLFAGARAEEKPKLQIELTAPKEIYPDEVVTVKAALRNGGKEDIQVLRDVDGAFDGLRNVVDFRWVVKTNGQLVRRRTDIIRIDNFINTIGAGDFVKVPAGKTADLGIGSFETYYNLKTPGKYTITLTYEFDPSAGDKIGPGVRDVLNKLSGVTAEGKTELTILPFPVAVAAAADKLKAAQARQQIARQLAEAVVANPASTAAEFDAAAVRLRRATEVVTDATENYNEKLAEFRKKREEQRKKK
jgi:hypothetical protein